MGWNDPDPYHQPEAFDLTIVGVLGDPSACWSFNDLAVWQHTDGRLFWARDSGCSCPSPFEDYTSLDQLTAITDETYNDFSDAVMSHCSRTEYAHERPLDLTGWTKSSSPHSTWWSRIEPDDGDFACQKLELLRKVDNARKDSA